MHRESIDMMIDSRYVNPFFLRRMVRKLTFLEFPQLHCWSSKKIIRPLTMGTRKCRELLRLPAKLSVLLHFQGE